MVLSRLSEYQKSGFVPGIWLYPRIDDQLCAIIQSRVLVGIVYVPANPAYVGDDSRRMSAFPGAITHLRKGLR